jgi:hypothetical protein
MATTNTTAGMQRALELRELSLKTPPKKHLDGVMELRDALCADVRTAHLQPVIDEVTTNILEVEVQRRFGTDIKMMR